jgi:hypothetical protein
MIDLENMWKEMVMSTSRFQAFTIKDSEKHQNIKIISVPAQILNQSPPKYKFRSCTACTNLLGVDVMNKHTTSSRFV